MNIKIRNYTVMLLSIIVLLVMPLCTSCTRSKKSENELTEKILEIGTLKGPTGMGMVKLIDDDKKRNQKQYNIEIYADPTEMTASLLRGDLDAAAVPVNMAPNICAKTNGQYQIAAINTLGVLHILERGNSIQTFSDLAGKTLYATGQGATPEYMIRYLLDINHRDDVTVSYCAEHSELMTMLISLKATIGMLPEPNVTTALTKCDELRIALDLTDEWEKATGTSPVQGCLILSTACLEKAPDAVSAFLNEYRQSVEYVNTYPHDAAKLIEEIGIVPSADIAELAIPRSHIVMIEGQEMVNTLQPFFTVLYDASPESIGGQMPDETIYYLD